MQADHYLLPGRADRAGRQGNQVKITDTRNVIPGGQGTGHQLGASAQQRPLPPLCASSTIQDRHFVDRSELAFCVVSSLRAGKPIGVFVEAIRGYTKVVSNPDQRITLAVVRRALRIEISGAGRRIEQDHHAVRLRAEF